MRPSLIALIGSLTAASALALPVTNTEGFTTRSFIPGNTFDRIVQIWLENQDYSHAILNST